MTIIHGITKTDDLFLHLGYQRHFNAHIDKYCFPSTKMESKSLSNAMSTCEHNPSCRKFYATQSHIDDISYYHYCGFHSQDTDFSLDQSTQYTLYTKKGEI